MSYEDGWAALHLEMPARVPRTEYSAEGHWALIRAVTGLTVTADSPAEERVLAVRTFMGSWNYGFVWSTWAASNLLEKRRTRMGHAVYAEGGSDWDTRVECPFSGPEEVLAFDPQETYGPCDRDATVRAFETAYRANCAGNPDTVSMTGIYVTLVSGLIDIFGWDLLLLASGMDPDGTGSLARRYADWILQYFEALAETDVPIVMVHDDLVWTSGAVWRPEWYRRFVFPQYKRLLAPLRDAGKRILFTSDGNYTQFVDDIAESGVHGFVMEPSTDMAYVAGKYGRTHVLVGNADTRILLMGTREEIRAEVERCMAVGKNCPGFFMAVGNHIPANTPVENALYYNEVYEELSRR